MWSREKILSKVGIDDDVKITLDSGLVFRGRLIAIDDTYNTVTLIEGFDEQNLLLDDIVSVTKILKESDIEVAKTLLNNSEQKDDTGTKQRDPD